MCEIRARRRWTRRRWRQCRRLPSRDDDQVEGRAAGSIRKITMSKALRIQLEIANVSYVQYDFQQQVNITNYCDYRRPQMGYGSPWRECTGDADNDSGFLTPLMNLIWNLMPLNAGYQRQRGRGDKSDAVDPYCVVEFGLPMSVHRWTSSVQIINATPIKIRVTRIPVGRCFFDSSCGASDIKALFKVGGDCTG